MRPNIIAWLLVCSFSYRSLSRTLSEDLQLRPNEKPQSTRSDGNEAESHDQQWSRDQQVLEYMVKLYKSVENGNNQLPVGNTVRSMAGNLMGLSDGSMLIVYNTSALSSAADNRILRADIRYFRHQPSPFSLHVDNETATYAILLEVTSRRFRPVGAHLVMTSRRSGWVTVDVTSSIRRFRRRTSRRRPSSLLALTFSGSSHGGEGGDQLATRRRRRTAAELRLLTSPTLVLFSRRTADIAVDHVLQRVPEYRSPPSTTSAWRSSAYRRRRKQTKKRHRRSKRSTELADGDISNWYPGFDNFLPLDNGNFTEPRSYNVPPVLANAAVLDPQQQQQHQDDKSDATIAADGLTKPTISSVEDGSEVALQHTANNDTMRRRTKNLQQTDSTSDLLNFAKTAKSDVRRQSVFCSKHRLIVDTADIGWNEHVIFPRQFQAGYCAGSCPFPKSKAVKQTNHATIQSLVHAVGIVAGVPAPCCVADEMWSLSVLYVDYDDSLVLTVYDDAVVRSCVCR